jgi:unsaturated rhamnogalacturonyl hydrolase
MIVKNLRIVLFFLLTMPVFLSSQPSVEQPWSVRMAESVMSRHPVTYGSWDYVTGTVLKGFEELWRTRGDNRYFQYIKNTLDMVVNENGTIDGYNLLDYNIDEINEGRMLLLLYKETGLEKYKKAADMLRNQLRDHPRTYEGGFWHKLRYPRQMWLDGLYMGSPFYAEYNLLFDEPEDFDDVVLQLTLMEKHARDPITGLLYHGWDESGEQDWADPLTGCSTSFWGRAIGWYAMALVDVLDYLPLDHTGRDSVIAIMSRLAEAMTVFQDESSGVWWQVVDQGVREGNYLESSVSCMMVYALGKAIRKGYINETYQPVVIKAYQGILNEFITENANETINLIQTCTTAGLGYGRDGSYDYYVYGTTVSVNDGKGVGPFITASLEIERLGAPTDLKAVTLSGDQIELYWKDNSVDEDGFCIERKQDDQFTEIARTSANDTTYIDQDLDPLTMYTYRIRNFKGEQYSVFSNNASAMTLAANGAPAYARNPFPPDNATDWPIDTQLKWQAGESSISHDVYFGVNNPPPFQRNQDSTSFYPGPLQENITYYWRIDEVNLSGTTTGNLWQFTTVSSPLPPTLIAHWSLDEDSGNTTADATGNDNNGTLFNMSDQSWQTGKIGNALLFDGIDDYVKVTHHSLLDFADQSFSVSFWIKQNEIDKAMRYLIKGTHTSPGSGKRYEVFHHSGNTVRFAIDDSVTKSHVEVPNTNFVTGEWVHVVAVRDTDTDQLRLYANAIMQGSAADQTGDISQNEDLYFGVSPDEANTNLNGQLDDIRLYNYALNDTAIHSLYLGGITNLNTNTNPNLPLSFSLGNYPNPFNPQTTIRYSVPVPGKIILAVYNLLGQEVDRLVDGHKQVGYHTIIYNASHLASGIYLCKLSTLTGTELRKIILLK